MTTDLSLRSHLEKKKDMGALFYATTYYYHQLQFFGFKDRKIRKTSWPKHILWKLFVKAKNHNFAVFWYFFLNYFLNCFSNRYKIYTINLRLISSENIFVIFLKKDNNDGARRHINN